MADNHTIRFPVSGDEEKSILAFWKAVEPDLKRTGFHRRVYLLGLQQMKKEAIKQGKKATLVKILE